MNEAQNCDTYLTITNRFNSTFSSYVFLLLVDNLSTPMLMVGRKWWAIFSLSPSKIPPLKAPECAYSSWVLISTDYEREA